MSLIEIEHLKYRYPNTKRLALDDINLSIEKGEFIGIVGENGAGKSTLGQAIIGLVPRFYNGAYGGKVLVKDILVEKQPVEEMCAYAVDAIIRQAAGEIIPVRTVLPVKLVERSST